MRLLEDPVLNNATAFSDAERDALDIRRPIPPHVRSQKQQVALACRSRGLLEFVTLQMYEPKCARHVAD